MDTVLYVGLSRQMTLSRSLEVVANNVANADTAGFKLESVPVQTEPASLPATPDGRPVNYVLDHGVARDFAQGSLEQTSNPLDIAIDGDGFFEIQTANGSRYTRDGRFTLDAQNRVVTKAGDPLLANGRPITVDPTQGAISVATDGTISQGVNQIGRLQAVRFPDNGALSKAGGNLFSAPPTVTPAPAPDALVHQGMVEHSNVQPVVEITRLIEITRAYERVTKMMDSNQDLSRSAVERLGKAS